MAGLDPAIYRGTSVAQMAGSSLVKPGHDGERRGNDVRGNDVERRGNGNETRISAAGSGR
jgi:hypothetical protein